MSDFLRTFSLRILALFLAFVIWFVVSAPRRERVSERTFAAPLSLVGMPRDQMITTSMPDTVNVRLRGRVSDLRSLSSQNLELTVDLSWVQPGEAVITLRPQAVNVPEHVEVVSVDPSKIRFRVEALRQRTVPVRPFLVGQPPSGYIAGDPTIVPEQVLVSGPASQIRNLTEVATERIIMTGRTAGFVQNVAVVSDTPMVRIIDPLTVQVSVPVNPEVGPNLPPAAEAETGKAQKARP